MLAPLPPFPFASQAVLLPESNDHLHALACCYKNRFVNYAKRLIDKNQILEKMKIT